MSGSGKSITMSGGIRVKQEPLDDHLELEEETPPSSYPSFTVKSEPSLAGLSQSGNAHNDPMELMDPPPPIVRQLEEPMKLTPEQSQVLGMVKDGKNVFFTGSAGCGKSVLLRAIIDHLHLTSNRRGWGINSIAVTASTGIAAININGCTLHSWAGIGKGSAPVSQLVSRLYAAHNKKKAKERRRGTDGRPHYVRDSLTSSTLERWRDTRVLIIDEISMIDGTLFDKLEEIACIVRKSLESKPFGGIQLVLSGDFLQLPPVPDRQDGVKIPSTFAFDASSWERCIGKPVYLNKVFRQREQTFVDILNAMRFGNMEPAAITRLRQLSRDIHYEDGIMPVDLFPTKLEVERRNHACLNAIQSRPYEYQALDSPGFDQFGQLHNGERLEGILNQLVAPNKVVLKISAQVMLIKNISKRLVNGSMGRVKEFITALDAHKKNYAISLTDDHRPNRWVEEEEEEEIILRKTSADDSDVGVPPSVLHSPRIWPVVEFQNGDKMLCIPDTFEVHNADGRIEAQRTQIPLVLAWAISIHKSQGQTLERVRVDLQRTFEYGQAYVALSRAKTMEGLQILNFDPLKVRAHPRVVEWMNEQKHRKVTDEVDADIEFWSEELDFLEADA